MSRPDPPDNATPPSASVIVSSYNYAPYLGEAIDSALAQACDGVEVIVVDDGSTDGSPDVVRSFGERVRAILKPNGGQASAWNAGYAASSGEVVIFLDSDDRLAPEAVATAVDLLADPAVAKAHWPLRVIGRAGRPTGRAVPKGALPNGTVEADDLADGARPYVWPPTSGNAWSRAFLDHVMPIPERAFVTCPDMYLALLAPAFGTMRATDRVLSDWRVHGDNHSWRSDVLDRLDTTLERIEVACGRIAQLPAYRGRRPDEIAWVRPWLVYIESLRSAIGAVLEVVPTGAAVAVADEAQWELSDTIAGRTVFAFPETDGVYRGRPADDDDAIAECEKLRSLGVEYLAVASPAFWWLDHYTAWAQYLGERGEPVVSTESLKVFRLIDAASSPEPTP